MYKLEARQVQYLGHTGINPSEHIEWAVHTDFDDSGQWDALAADVLKFLMGIGVESDHEFYKLATKYKVRTSKYFGGIQVFATEQECREFLENEVIPRYIAHSLGGSVKE